MKKTKLTDRIDLGVLNPNTQVYESDGKYFVDGPHNIVQTVMIEVIPLSSITEEQAYKIMGFTDERNYPALGDLHLLVVQAIKKVGYPGIREPEENRPEEPDPEDYYWEQHDESPSYDRAYGIWDKEREQFDNSVPTSRIILIKTS